MEKQLDLLSIILKNGGLAKDELLALRTNLVESEKLFTEATLNAMKSEAGFVATAWNNVLEWKGDELFLEQIFPDKYTMILHANDIRSDRAATIDYILKITDLLPEFDSTGAFSAPEIPSFQDKELKTKAAKEMIGGDTWKQTMNNIFATRTRLRLARLAVEVELYALEHNGKRPEKLSSAGMDKLTRNPFNGKEIKYINGNYAKDMKKAYAYEEYDYSSMPVTGICFECEYPLGKVIFEAANASGIGITQE